MLGRLPDLIRRRGPLGALALAATLGAATGLLALNAVLAGWTYRDAARRDLRRPGRWALATLLAGPLAFVPYSALQWYRDRSTRTDHPDADAPVDRDRQGMGAGDGTAGTPDGMEDAPGGMEETSGGVEEAPGGVRGVASGPAGSIGSPAGPAVERGGADRRSVALARTTVHYGGKAAALGVRGALWAGRRAVDRMNNG